jgi:hypothetical protein
MFDLAMQVKRALLGFADNQPGGCYATGINLTDKPAAD